MDRKKKQSAGGGGALYAAIAVCLLAVGVGSWQFFHRDAARTAAESRISAVSGPASVAEQDGEAKAPDLEAGAAASSDTSAAPSQAATPAHTAQSDTAGKTDSGTAGKTNSATAADGGAAGKTANSATGEKTGGTVTNSSTEGKTGGTAGTSGANASTLAEETAAASGSAVIPAETADNPDAQADASDAQTAAADAQSVADTLDGQADTSDAQAAADTREIMMSLPLEGEAVTVFSMAQLIYNETLRDWRTHDGIDVAAEEGTAVCAALDGTVASVSDDPLMGTTVVIRHEGELETVYACLGGNVEIEAGDDVSAGQVIGFVGQSAGAEAALGPHLHFSVLENGEAADPSAFLP